MCSIYKAIYNKKNILFLLVTIMLLNGNLFGQTTYAPNIPKHLVMEVPVINGWYVPILMQPCINGDDGIMVKFHLKFYLLTFGERSKPIIAFYYMGHPILKMQSVDIKTIRVERSDTTGIKYQYELYDKMFYGDEGGFTMSYDIEIYVSNNFTFIHTQSTEYENNNYVSPLFFGLNLPGCDVINHFLMGSIEEINSYGKSSGIEIGDFVDKANSSLSSYISNVKVYSFKYSDLQNDIDQNFSKQN
jgi:hypothetical protein